MHKKSLLLLLAYGILAHTLPVLALDMNNPQIRQYYEKEIAECDNVPKDRLIAQGMAENDKPWDVTNGVRQGIVLAREYSIKCKREVQQRYFGQR